jgi:shikimate dehydrogenase
MRKFGLIGYPLVHSFSRQYFAEKFAREGITDSGYENYPLEDIEMLPGLVSNIPNLCGLNVTIPHKTNVLRFLDQMDCDARTAGAVNVIKISSRDDRPGLRGFNTDIYGFRESLLPYLKESHYSALILGTGGSSLAVKYVLTALGISFRSVSRNRSSSDLTYSDLSGDMLKEYNIIINTTPLGMYPDVDSCPEINYNALTGRHILFDLVYNPEMTRFLSLGADRGCTIIGGLRMLHLQAEKSWSIWNDDNL